LKTPARYLTLLALAVLALWQPAYGATTLLPSGESCFSALTPTSGGPGNTGTGFVGLLGPITAGTGGTSATYGGVALTGGAGTGATANITVAGGVVTQVAILNPGAQYVVGDVLSAVSATIGNVSGFSVPVLSVAINSSLAGGKVYFYVPNTSTFKQTWQDSAQTILNQNPVILDANGCGIIYGTGTYRQVLQDSLSNTIWDAITTDTSAYNSTFWAGIAGGTPNAITVVDVGFNGTDGSVLNFTALATNTGPTTINPSGYGAITVLQDTTAGPVALAPGQIIQGNVISVVYRAQDNAFHLLNPPIQSANGAIAPLCGASRLNITNGTSPSSIISLTAKTGVMVSSAGLVINRSNISLPAINITTGTTVSTINGMDGEAPGTSAWVYIWIIDNGSSSAGLVSLASGNGLSPTLPSGYIYACRLGAMMVDGSGNLLRTNQNGQDAQYKIVAASNTTAFPTLASAASPSAGLITVSGVTIPLTASSIRVMGASSNTSNNGWFVSSNADATFPPIIAGGTNGTFIQGTVILETTQIYQSTQTNATIYVAGWKDSVNAN
jgi:hypothetical protein